jgi:hypothetical protein
MPSNSIGGLPCRDAAQHTEIAEAAEHLEPLADGWSPLVGAAIGVHAWLDKGGMRPPVRVALAGYWARQGRPPSPARCSAALRAEVRWAREQWIGHFLEAVAEEAASLERHWFGAASGCRKTPRFARQRGGRYSRGGAARLGHLARVRARHGDKERDAAALKVSSCSTLRAR